LELAIAITITITNCLVHSSPVPDIACQQLLRPRPRYKLLVSFIS